MRSAISGVRLSSKEAAHYLALSETTLRKSRVNGCLCGSPAPFYSKRGVSVYYDIEDLDLWLSQFPKGRSSATLYQHEGACDD